MSLRLVWLFLATLLLTACAAPRWQTVYQYEPPTGGEGAACAQRCVDNQQACRLEREDRYQHCLERADSTARDGFEALMSRYELEMRAYFADLARYKMERDRYEHRRTHLAYEKSHYERRCKEDARDRTACELAEKARRELKHLERHRPLAPARPERPSLADEVSKARASCARNCGCIETYNACYAACGGRVIPQQRCIDNCPDGVPRFEPVMP